MYAMLLGACWARPGRRAQRQHAARADPQARAARSSRSATRSPQAGGYLKDVDAVLASKYPELKLPPIRNVGISGQKAEDLVKRFQHDVVDKQAGHRDDQRRDQRRLAPRRPTARPARAGRVLGQRRQDGRHGAKSGNQGDLAHADGHRRKRGGASANKRLRIYVEAEKQIARERKCTLVDLHEMFLTAMAKRPADVGDKENWLTCDGVHMNPLGDALDGDRRAARLGVPDRLIAADAS